MVGVTKDVTVGVSVLLAFVTMLRLEVFFLLNSSLFSIRLIENDEKQV